MFIEEAFPWPPRRSERFRGWGLVYSQEGRNRSRYRTGERSLWRHFGLVMAREELQVEAGRQASGFKLTWIPGETLAGGEIGDLENPRLFQYSSSTSSE